MRGLSWGTGFIGVAPQLGRVLQQPIQHYGILLWDANRLGILYEAMVSVGATKREGQGEWDTVVWGLQRGSTVKKRRK